MSVASIADRLDVVRATGRFPEPVLQQFAQHITSAPEEEVFRINPLRYADDRGLARQQVIDLFLHATHVGLLGFTWGVLCPACSAFIVTEPALKALDARRECSLCQVDVRVSDENVEVAFTVPASVRRIRFHDLEGLDLERDGMRVFFSSNRILPAEMAEALASMKNTILHPAKLRPGENTLPVELSAGWYGFFAPSLHAWSHFEVRPGEEAEQSLELVEGGFVPRMFAIAPGRGTLRIENRTGRVVAGGVVRRLYPPPGHGGPVSYEIRLRPYLTGKMLVTSQAFRDLFRTQSVPGEGGLEFKSLTVLFTDLKGSTELYERIGDFRAYSLVRRHFEILREIIAARGGSMVKTIGDAVMASFAEPVTALSAAADMNREIRKVDEQGQTLELKIGLHTGSCIAVELNERLDYFGQTVNIAARVQGEAAASEIVCTEPVYVAPGAREAVEAAALTVRRDRAHLKGVDGEVTVYRMR